MKLTPLMCQIIVVVIVLSTLLTGCSSTVHLSVRDSTGAVVPKAVAFLDASSIYPHVGHRTEVVLCNSNGFGMIKGGGSEIAVGKVGYFPAIVSFTNIRSVVQITLYKTNETHRCITSNPLRDAYIHRAPYYIRVEQTDAYARWQEYLQWLDLQPQLLSRCDW